MDKNYEFMDYQGSKFKVEIIEEDDDSAIRHLRSDAEGQDNTHLRSGMERTEN